MHNTTRFPENISSDLNENANEYSLDSSANVSGFSSKKSYDSVLSSLVFYRSYSKTLPSGKKETISQTIQRVADMHIQKFPQFKDEITQAFSYVHAGKVVPSMRSMQFAGEPVHRSNSRIYNCTFTCITSWNDIADIFFKLMNGCGVGYSVQYRHIGQLPEITAGHQADYIVVPDSKEGWADSLVQLFSNVDVPFDYSAIRPHGALLSTGGTASGPQPLIKAHQQIRSILKNAVGRKLNSREVHSIVTLASDCVVVGGVRRSALISLFDCDDNDMLTLKQGNWWESNPQYARANNSAVIHRDDPDFESKLRKVMKACFDSYSGEPGLYLTNDYDLGTNPCAEISLRDGQLCNLTEVNVAACADKNDFLEAVRAATLIGTLQATYTDFKYVQSKFKKNCEEEALLGVSITGQAQKWDILSDAAFLSTDAASVALSTNADWAEKLGINKAARIGCTKPSGSTSAFLGSTSGIHAAHSPYYLRRVRVDMSDPIASYLISIFGLNDPCTNSVIERDNEKPDKNIVITIPISKENAIVRSKETSIDLLNRAKHIFDNWIKTTHRSGQNYHNVSLTVSYMDNDAEKENIIKWMLENKESYAGISLLPYDDHVYKQAPFEEISEEKYASWLNLYASKNIDFSNIDFSGTEDNRQGEVACGGGYCEVK